MTIVTSFTFPLHVLPSLIPLQPHWSMSLSLQVYSEPSVATTLVRTKAQVLPAAHKAMLHLLVTSLLSPPPADPVIHSVPTTRASLLFFKHAKHLRDFCTGCSLCPEHSCLTSSWGCFFLSFRSQIQLHLLGEALNKTFLVLLSSWDY